MTKPHTLPITSDTNADAPQDAMTLEELYAELDATKDMTEEELDARYGKIIGPRVTINPYTGGPVVVGRPRAPKISSEFVRKELEDFP